MVGLNLFNFLTCYHRRASEKFEYFQARIQDLCKGGRGWPSEILPASCSGVTAMRKFWASKLGSGVRPPGSHPPISAPNFYSYCLLWQLTNSKRKPKRIWGIEWHVLWRKNTSWIRSQSLWHEISDFSMIDKVTVLSQWSNTIETRDDNIVIFFTSNCLGHHAREIYFF